jgi:hypothetical protein
MTTQLDFEKRKKQNGNSDVKTNASPVLFPPTPDKKQANDTTADQIFCVFCKCYHKPNAQIRCALNRAFKKIDGNHVEST